MVGGGTAGHIEPALAVGEAVTALDPTARVTAVGTPRGLETELVPRRGVPLELVDPVPLPRSIGGHSIGIRERDEWLACMDQAMGDIGVDPPLRERLRGSFFQTADWMRT